MTLLYNINSLPHKIYQPCFFQILQIFFLWEIDLCLDICCLDLFFLLLNFTMKRSCLGMATKGAPANLKCLKRISFVIFLIGF